MNEKQTSYWYASVIFVAGFTSVAVDSGIIPHFETIGRFFGTDGNSMLSTLTAFNGAFVAGLLYGSVFSGPKHLGRSFFVTALVLAISGVLASTTGSMPRWLGAWAILGFASGLLSHLSWVFTLNVGHSGVVMSRMISAQLSARPMGIALGVPLFTFLASFRGWSHSLLIFSIAAAAGSALLGVLTLRHCARPGGLPSMPDTPDDSLLKHYRTMANPGLLLLLLGNLFYGMSYLGLYGVLGIVLTKLYGFSPERIGYVFGALGAVEGGSAFISPWLFGKFKRTSLVRFFAAFSFVLLCALFGSSMNHPMFTALLVVFAFGARQLIFASFKSAGEAIAVIAPACPIGTFVIMAAWGGFSLSTFLLEKIVGSYGIGGVGAYLIATYLAGLFFLLGFFQYDFKQSGRRHEN